MKAKKHPIIFADGPQDKLVEGEQIMDVLIHYAQSGILEAEKVICEEPSFFSQEEVMDLAASKTVLLKAPDIISAYKRKYREFTQLHEKVQNIVNKCEHIVHDYEGRHRSVKPEADPLQDEHATQHSGKPRLDANMIRYTANGEIIVKKSKKVIIEPPKHNKH